MESELKHVGWEDNLAARGNAWVLEILVYIEVTGVVKDYELLETEKRRVISNVYIVD